MWDPITIAGAVCLQLGVDVCRQFAFALPIAFAWEFEKSAIWGLAIEQTAAAEVGLLITGLTAGAISVLTWPDGSAGGNLFVAIAALASPLVTGGLMFRTGRLFRELGQSPPSMFGVRDATIFAAGISLMRTAAALLG